MHKCLTGLNSEHTYSPQAWPEGTYSALSVADTYCLPCASEAAGPQFQDDCERHTLAEDPQGVPARIFRTCTSLTAPPGLQPPAGAPPSHSFRGTPWAAVGRGHPLRVGGNSAGLVAMRLGSRSDLLSALAPAGRDPPRAGRLQLAAARAVGHGRAAAASDELQRKRSVALARSHSTAHALASPPAVAEAAGDHRWANNSLPSPARTRSKKEGIP